MGWGRSEVGLETRELQASCRRLHLPSQAGTLPVARKNNVLFQGMFSPGFLLLLCRHAPSRRSPLHKFYFTSLVFLSPLATGEMFPEAHK